MFALLEAIQLSLKSSSIRICMFTVSYSPTYSVLRLVKTYNMKLIHQWGGLVVGPYRYHQSLLDIWQIMFFFFNPNAVFCKNYAFVRCGGCTRLRRKLWLRTGCMNASRHRVERPPTKWDLRHQRRSTTQSDLLRRI